MRCTRHFSIAADGFHGSYFPCPEKTDKAFIEMFGDDTDDLLAKGGVGKSTSVYCIGAGLA